MRILKKTIRFLLIFGIILSWSFNYPPDLLKSLGGQGWPQIFNFPHKIEIAQAVAAYDLDCDGTMQTAASAVVISACDIGTGITDGIIIERGK